MVFDLFQLPYEPVLISIHNPRLILEFLCVTDKVFTTLER